MQIFRINDEHVESTFKFSLKNKKLIPIIGAGFTKGENARNGTVPCATELQDIMISEICSTNKDITRSDFEHAHLKFSEIATEYFKFVSKEKQKELLLKRFNQVNLNNEKKRFLEVNWPYIYTLNIDDAIERNSRYTPISTYRKISNSFRDSEPCVYKMHGDVLEEIKYEDESPNIIFSSEQYIKSLQENASILNTFQSDYLSNNMIFIGCSLQDEIDLTFAIETIKDSFPDGSKRIFITTEPPKGLRKSKLERFGINMVVIVDDYREIYEKIIDWSKEIVIDENDEFNEYKNFKIDVLGKAIKENKDFITDIAGTQSSSHSLPFYYTIRDLAKEILSKYKDEVFTVISGKRFSGKTFLAKTICKSIVDRDIYFFPSIVSLSNNELDTIAHIKNATIIFDSSTLTLENALYLEELEEKIESSNSNVILLTNKNDSLFTSVALRLTHNNFYELSNKFSPPELFDVNSKLSALGLINTTPNKSIIENCYKYNEIYETNFSIDTTKYNNDHILLMILLATDSKIYSITTRAFDIKRKDVIEFCKKLSPFVEMSESKLLESHQHSGFKIILNSPSWIFHILSCVYRDKGEKTITAQIKRIVKTLKEKGNVSSTYNKIIGFDNLNQIFHNKQQGVVSLISSIYNSLEETLYHDPHYWLQRAKSSLYISRKNTQDLTLAIDFAKKAFYDTENTKLKINATTTLALLYGRLTAEEKYENDKNIEEAVDWYYQCLQDKGINKRYIDGIINKNRERNDLNGLLRHLMSPKGTRLNKFKPGINTQIDYLMTAFITHNNHPKN